VIERARIAGHHVVRVSGHDRDPLGDLRPSCRSAGRTRSTTAIAPRPRAADLDPTGSRRARDTSRGRSIIDDVDAMPEGRHRRAALFVRQKIRQRRATVPADRLGRGWQRPGPRDRRRDRDRAAADVLTLTPLDAKATVNLVRDLTTGEPGAALGKWLHGELGEPGSDPRARRSPGPRRMDQAVAGRAPPTTKPRSTS
jgi:hypothetical protein